MSSVDVQEIRQWNKNLYREDRRNQVDRSLEDYSNEAKVLVKAYGGLFKQKLFTSDDRMSYLTAALMLADWRYDPNYRQEHQASKSSYRVYCAKHAIRYLQKKSPITPASFEEGPTGATGNTETLGRALGFDDNSINPISRFDDEEEMSYCLSKLPPRHAQCIRLYYYESMRTSEIAEVMGISHQRVQQLISKSLVRLRELFERRIN